MGGTFQWTTTLDHGNRFKNRQRRSLRILPGPLSLADTVIGDDAHRQKYNPVKKEAFSFRDESLDLNKHLTELREITSLDLANCDIRCGLGVLRMATESGRDLG
jgi:hypothetical protein